MSGKYNQYNEIATCSEVAEEDLCSNSVNMFRYNCEERYETIHPLFLGIHQEDYERVESELETLCSYDLSNLTYAGQTPLHAACQTKGFEVMNLILEKGVKIGLTNAFGETPLHIAVSESWLEGTKALLRLGANPDALTEQSATVKINLQQTPFHIALKQGYIPIVKLLLLSHPNLSLRDSHQNTPLHLACVSHSVELIKILLERNECLNASVLVNEHGDTPLHSLLKKNKNSGFETEILKCAKLLVRTKCDINFRNNKGETCLYLACKANLPTVAEYLINVGASLTLLNAGGKSAIHAACFAGSPKTLRLLLSDNRMKQLVLLEDFESHSAFHMAVESFSIDCCQLLLENGDHLLNQDSKGITRCSLVLNNIPSSSELLTRLFDSHIKTSSSHIHDSNFKVIFDFSILLSSNPFLQKSLLEEITSQRRFEHLLKHPLLESFLHIKWSLIKWFFYAGVINFGVFLIFHTVILMMSFNSQNTTNRILIEDQRYLSFVRIIYILFYVIILIPEMFVAVVNSRKYLSQFETYSKLIVLSTSIYLAFTIQEKRVSLLQRNLAAISVLFGWMNVMLQLGKFPKYGVYILMFTRISKSMTSFLCSFCFVVVGYSCAFGIVFYEVETFDPFLPLTILKTIMMMTGEIDYETIYSQANFSRVFHSVEGQNSVHLFANDALRIILLTSFIFLVPILLANLLIGLAVNDIPDLQRQGNVRRLAKQAAFIVSYERLCVSLKKASIFPHLILKLLTERFAICSEITLYPNKSTHYRKRPIKVPTEILREAIGIASKMAAEEVSRNVDPKKNFEVQFKQFLLRYRGDMEEIKEHLGFLCSIEKMNKSRVTTMDAAKLSKMGDQDLIGNAASTSQLADDS